MTAEALERPTAAPPLLDLARFTAIPLAHAPFDHLVVPGFIPASALPAIEADYPRIARGGSFPAQSLFCGPAMLALLDALQSAETAAAFGAKFGLDLAARPTMVTLRGQSRPKDGRIHTDSKSKLVTALIYLNSGWESPGGRLRLLNGPDDIDDYVVEVPPAAGMLLAFRCSDNAWHGHKPFAGPRRSIQLNWVTDEGVVKRELGRHGFSALVKRLVAPLSGKKT